MIDKIRFSIFEKLNPDYLGYLEEPNGNDDEDHEDCLIYDTLIGNVTKDDIFVKPPEEITSYSKLKSNELSFEDTTGLKVLPLHIDQTQNTKKKREKKRSHAMDHTEKLIGSDLVTGFDDYKHPELPDIYLMDDLYKSVEHLILTKGYTLKDFKILTLRRHLQKLMNVPINKQPIQFNVIFWKGLIFFSYDWEPEAKKELATPPTKIERLLQYSGMKFERVLCDDNDPDYRYYTVAKHYVNDIPLIYSAEIDCAIDKDGGPTKYVELKTHPKQADDKIKTMNRLNKKLLSTYCQNRFIHCQHLILGFRTLDFKLASLKIYRTSDIANVINNDPIFLKHGCLITTKKIFRWYKIVISWIAAHEKKLDNLEDEPQVFKLNFDREEELMDAHLNLQKIQDKTESDRIFNLMIPEWFQSFVKNQS